MHDRARRRLGVGPRRTPATIFRIVGMAIHIAVIVLVIASLSGVLRFGSGA